MLKFKNGKCEFNKKVNNGVNVTSPYMVQWLINELLPLVKWPINCIKQSKHKLIIIFILQRRY